MTCRQIINLIKGLPEHKQLKLPNAQVNLYPEIVEIYIYGEKGIAKRCASNSHKVIDYFASFNPEKEAKKLVSAINEKSCLTPSPRIRHQLYVTFLGLADYLSIPFELIAYPHSSLVAGYPVSKFERFEKDIFFASSDIFIDADRRCYAKTSYANTSRHKFPEPSIGELTREKLCWDLEEFIVNKKDLPSLDELRQELDVVYQDTVERLKVIKRELALYDKLNADQSQYFRL